MRDFLKFWKNFFNLRKRAEHLTLKSTLHRFLKRLFAVYTFTDRRRSQTFLTSSSKHEFQLCVNYALHFNGIAAAIPILRLVLDIRLLKSAGERDGALRTLFWTLPWSQGGIQLVRLLRSQSKGRYLSSFNEPTIRIKANNRVTKRA